MHLASRGVVLRPIAAADGGVTREAVAKAIGPRTRVVSVSSVEFATGVASDLEAIGALCRERGVLFCVDGIQSVGAFPIDMVKANIDFLSADSHKWQLGLPGIGIGYVRRDISPKHSAVGRRVEERQEPARFRSSALRAARRCGQVGRRHAELRHHRGHGRGACVA
jgi:selenocysteine lyase/cysteine desulfurase